MYIPDLLRLPFPMSQHVLQKKAVSDLMSKLSCGHSLSSPPGTFPNHRITRFSTIREPADTVTLPSNRVNPSLLLKTFSGLKVARRQRGKKTRPPLRGEMGGREIKTLAGGGGSAAR